MIDESIKHVFELLRDAMEHSIEHTQHEYQKLRAGKASPRMLDGIMVEYYGSDVPLNQVATVSTPDARSLWIQPFEKGIMQDIERAIINANLGYTPQNDGERVIINIPPLTEERRKDLVKNLKNEAENGKISLRNARRDAIEEVRKAKKEGLSEDLAKDAEEEIQKVLEEYTSKIDSITASKEKEIMTI